jgi:cobalamin biosynthetic protein CobC
MRYLTMLEHGGNLALASIQYRIPLDEWLDLSTGINPNGYPIAEIPASIWQRLPLDNDGLIEAACAYYGCQFALATAGSQAALQILPQLRNASKVAMPALMYQEHAKAWQHHGHQITTFDAYPDENIIKNSDVVLLCSPNNPTATQFAITDLLNWHAQLAVHGGWLVVDEAFMDVTPALSIAQQAHLDGLFVLRSLGKFFGLAGARVGFLLGAEKALVRAQEQVGPWSIAGPSRFIAKQALTDSTWQQNTRLHLPACSQRLARLLTQYGLTPSSGTALFQFILTNQAVAWQQHLAKQGIWVRLFSGNSKSGISGFAKHSAIRFGLPPESTWERLEAALKNF